jgi:hypothetical protein
MLIYYIMKSVYTLSQLILVLVLLAGIQLNAQSATGKMLSKTESNGDQKASVQIQRAEVNNEIEHLKLQIAQNESRFSTLMSIENPDMNALYQNIDELHVLKNRLSKFRLQLLKLTIFGR